MANILQKLAQPIGSPGGYATVEEWRKAREQFRALSPEAKLAAGAGTVKVGGTTYTLSPTGQMVPAVDLYGAPKIRTTRTTTTAPTTQQPTGVSLDPLYRAIQQYTRTPIQMPQAQTPQVFDLQQLLAAVMGIPQAGGVLPTVPEARYQTPEQLSQLMQTWLNAMQPYIDVQTQQAQEAVNQLLQRLRGRWGAAGLAASPGFAITQAEEARRLAQVIAGIQAAAQQEALGRAMEFAELGLAEQQQLWGMGMERAQFELARQQAYAQALASGLSQQEAMRQAEIAAALQVMQMRQAQQQFGVSALAQALGMDIGQYQFAQQLPLQVAQLTGLYQGQPTLAAQQFAWEQLLGRMSATGQLPEAWGGGPTFSARQWEREQAFREESFLKELAFRHEQLNRQMAAEWARINLMKKDNGLSEWEIRAMNQEMHILETIRKELAAYRAAVEKKKWREANAARQRALDAVTTAYELQIVSHDFYTRALNQVLTGMPELQQPQPFRWFDGFLGGEAEYLRYPRYSGHPRAVLRQR